MIENPLTLINSHTKWYYNEFVALNHCPKIKRPGSLMIASELSLCPKHLGALNTESTIANLAYKTMESVVVIANALIQVKSTEVT